MKNIEIPTNEHGNDPSVIIGTAGKGVGVHPTSTNAIGDMERKHVKPSKQKRGTSIFITDTELLIFVIIGTIVPALWLNFIVWRSFHMTGTAWLDILIGIATSILSALGTTVFVYYKFLKKVPDETKEKIDTLLNQRLSYETENHNAIADHLNPDNRHLSREHYEIRTKVDDIHSSMAKGEERRKAYQSELRSNHSSISASIEKISVVPQLIEELQEDNAILIQRLEVLEEENHGLKENIRDLKNEISHYKQHNLDMDIDR